MSEQATRDCRRDPSSGRQLDDNGPPEVPPYDIGGAVDVLVEQLADYRWDVVSDAMSLLLYGFVRSREVK